MNKKIIIILLIVVVLILIAIINNSKKVELSENKIEKTAIENQVTQNDIDDNETASPIKYYVKFNTETQKYEIVNSSTNNVEFSCSTENELAPKYKELTGKEYMH